MFCATDWAGFAEQDLGHIVAVMSDFSKFNTLADRMQQGFLNQMFLGRAMIHPQGLSTNAAFQKNGQGVIDTRRLFFDGNSQGGIMGGALTALAPDFDRAVLGVPGMNYSTLLQRSVDFESFAPIIYGGYPKQLERQLWLSQIQLLWDRGESNGYAHHITSRPAAEHAAAQRPHARGLRRPSGRRSDGGGHGAYLRCPGPQTGTRSGPLGAREPVVRAEGVEAAEHGLRNGLVGCRPRAGGGRGGRGNAGASHRKRATATRP